MITLSISGTNHSISDAYDYASMTAIYSSHMATCMLYVFRHNYCTELYYSGVSLKQAQEYIGHSDYTMIMNVYSRLDEEKEKAKEKVARIT